MPPPDRPPARIPDLQSNEPAHAKRPRLHSNGAVVPDEEPELRTPARSPSVRPLPKPRDSSGLCRSAVALARSGRGAADPRWARPPVRRRRHGACGASVAIVDTSAGGGDRAPLRGRPSTVTELRRSRRLRRARSRSHLLRTHRLDPQRTVGTAAAQERRPSVGVVQRIRATPTVLHRGGAHAGGARGAFSWRHLAGHGRMSGRRDAWKLRP